MTSANGAKGYRAERAIELLLTPLRKVHRPRAGSAKDCGDIGGLPVVISVKDWGRLELGVWVTQMVAMCRNAGCTVGVVWHKRRGKGDPKDWYVTTTGAMFVELLEAYMRCPQLEAERDDALLEREIAR